MITFTMKTKYLIPRNILGRKTWAKILYKRHKIRQYVQHSGMKINSHQVNLKMNTISLKKILKVFAFGKLMIKFYFKKM